MKSPVQKSKSRRRCNADDTPKLITMSTKRAAAASAATLTTAMVKVITVNTIAHFTPAFKR